MEPDERRRAHRAARTARRRRLLLSRDPAASAQEQLAGWLRGRWSIDRVINGAAGAFTGTASFVPDASALMWHESGTLRLGDHESSAHRTLRLAPGPDGTWHVAFQDGRPFHDLDLRTGRCTVEHRCGADVYRGVYELRGTDAFAVTWRVNGPRKDDVIASLYERAT